MLIDLLDKLVDRCIQLAKRGEEVSRSLFDEFVEPVYLQFETVHSAYLESFRRYRSVIKNTENLDTDASDLLDQIRTDSLFTADQRERIRVFLAVSGSPLVGDFVSSIQGYLDRNLSDLVGSNGSGDTGLSVAFSNVWRQSLLEVIQRIMAKALSDEEKRDKCILELDRIVAELQESHATVSAAYTQLRHKLLRMQGF